MCCCLGLGRGSASATAGPSAAPLAMGLQEASLRMTDFFPGRRRQQHSRLAWEALQAQLGGFAGELLEVVEEGFDGVLAFEAAEAVFERVGEVGFEQGLVGEIGGLGGGKGVAQAIEGAVGIRVGADDA